MRLTDDRYSNERSQFELALRMIRHEARTRTIRECTGLSDDRIRKLYTTYFRNGGTDVRRRRGGLLLRLDAGDRIRPRWPRPDVEFGHRVCRAYETYLMLHEDATLSFEWAWNLLQAISFNDELYLAVCGKCRTRYVQDAYALDDKTCPCCEIEESRSRRPGVHGYS
jgi:hypothetical protein